MTLNFKAVAGTLGVLLFFLGVSLAIPTAVALGYREASWVSFAGTAFFSLVVGGLAWQSWGRDLDQLRIREGFAIVATAWLVLSLIGAFPYVLSGEIPSYTDAFFETMSGFTTTGASILGGPGAPQIEEISHGLLFWRSLTQWLGGMGIIVLALAVLPILGVGGMQLFKAEVPGPSADKLTPRVRETAKRLWMIYVGLTVLQAMLLMRAMSPFDAITHALSTMATGGFSTRNTSVGYFESAYVEWITTLFMYLAGVSFVLHYRLLKREARGVFRNTELRIYTLVIVLSTLLVSLSTWSPVMNLMNTAGGYSGYASFGEALRAGAFQVTTIATTTGFVTADYVVWPPLAVAVIFLLFFLGGMAGSTSGGIKVVRQVVLFENSFREIRRLLHPNAVIPLRLNGRVVPSEVIREVLSFVILYLALVILGTIVLAFFGLDLLSALGAAASCLGNIGPAFGTLGPTASYAAIPDVAKWFLAILMMAGRLEIFTVLILFVPGFWRR
jgi:trk system potassium uptake protein TrkH